MRSGSTLNKIREINKNKTLYLFMLPFALIFAAFVFIPVVISVYYSFTSFNVLEVPKWTGIDNYVRLFLYDRVFLIAIKNTFLFAAITGPVGYILCFLFAWLLNEMTPKLRAVLTLFFYAPSLTNIYVIWKVIFSGDTYGLINAYLLKFGVISEPVLWLSNPDYMKTIIIIVALWSSLGTSFLAFIAGFGTVDRGLYEAAAIDGIKNRGQELWYVTLPVMRPQLLFAAVLSIAGSFGIGSIITNLVGSPSTDYAAHTIMNHLDDFGSVRFEMGYACTIATILFLIMVFSNKLVQKLLFKIGK